MPNIEVHWDALGALALIPQEQRQLELVANHAQWAQRPTQGFGEACMLHVFASIEMLLASQRVGFGSATQNRKV